jgi:hypothetical protein
MKCWTEQYRAFPQTQSALTVFVNVTQRVATACRISCNKFTQSADRVACAKILSSQDLPRMTWITAQATRMHKHTTTLACIYVREGTNDNDNTALVVGVRPMMQGIEDRGKWHVKVYSFVSL